MSVDIVVENTRPVRERALTALICLVPAALMAAHARYYYFLCDDAYIAFRYAHDLVVGRGLTFNAGERVEGYTSLAWTLQLALGERLGLSLEVFSSCLTVFYTVATVGVLAAFILEQRAPLRRLTLFVALLLLATHRSWAIWTTGGLETRCLSFFVATAFYTLFRAEREGAGRRRVWLGVTSTAVAFAALTRPDAQLLLPLCVAFVVVRRRVFAWNDVGVLVVPFSCLIGAHYLWRHAYYGYWLPNTYYAKIASHGPWPDLGWRFAAAFGLTYGYFLTLPIVALLWRLVPSSLTRGLGVLVLVYFSLHAGYYCYRVGGDHFEFRIFDPFVPFFCWAIAEVFVIGFQRRRAVALILGAEAFGYSIAVPAVMTATNDEVSADVVSQFGSATRMRPGPISRALLPGISRIFRWDSRLFLELNKHLVATPQAAHRQFWRGSREMMRHLRNASLPPMTVTATNIGTLGYFLDAPIVDAFGLTDSEVAHHGRALSSRLMAHDLRPPRGYLLERGVNAAVLGVLPNPQVDEGVIAFLREVGIIPEEVPWKPYSIALRDGWWLNIASWDEAWVRRNFREVRGRLFPRSRPRRRE